MGIRCKKIPDLFEPIIAIPLIQQINEAKPGKITTQLRVNTKGRLKSTVQPNFISIKKAGNNKIKPEDIIICKSDNCDI